MSVEGFPKIADASVMASPEIAVHGRRFQLIAAIEHVGESLNSGHYVVLRRETLNRWRVLNDSGLTPIGPEHGTVMSDVEMLQRQMYVCLYAQDGPACEHPVPMRNGTFTGALVTAAAVAVTGTAVESNVKRRGKVVGNAGTTKQVGEERGMGK